MKSVNKITLHNANYKAYFNLSCNSLMSYLLWQAHMVMFFKWIQKQFDFLLKTRPIIKDACWHLINVLQHSLSESKLIDWTRVCRKPLVTFHKSMMAFPAHCKHILHTRAVTPAVSTVNSPFRRKTEVAFNVSVNSSHGNKL